MRIEKAITRLEALHRHCLNMMEITPAAADTWEQDAEALEVALRVMRQQTGTKAGAEE